MTTTKIVGFFAGPGSGKSTHAAGLFAALKRKGVNCELVTEFAKQMTWSQRQAEMDSQYYIFGKQYHKLHTLLGKVSVIITDSPLILGCLYNADKTEVGQTFDHLVMQVYKRMDNINVFVNRNKPYNTAGRNQTEDQSRVIDDRIRSLLNQHHLPYLEVNSDTETQELVDKVWHLLLNDVANRI